MHTTEQKLAKLRVATLRMMGMPLDEGGLPIDDIGILLTLLNQLHKDKATPELIELVVCLLETHPGRKA